MVRAVPVCFKEERSEHKNEVVNLPVNLHSPPRLWSWAVGSKPKNEITDIWKVSGMRSSHRKESVEVVLAFFFSFSFSFYNVLLERCPHGGTWTRWRDCIAQLVGNTMKNPMTGKCGCLWVTWTQMSFSKSMHGYFPLFCFFSFCVCLLAPKVPCHSVPLYPRVGRQLQSWYVGNWETHTKSISMDKQHYRPEEN